tara:strand:+ start:223 stop:786 length:564 start_codon:yes stop_codon:yes gene_type:complete
MAFTRGLPKKPKRPVQGKGRAAGQADERRDRKMKRITKKMRSVFDRPKSGAKPMVDPKRKVGDMPLTPAKRKKAPTSPKVADFVPKPFKPKKAPTSGGMAKGGAMKAKGMKAGGKMKAKGMMAGGKMKAKGMKAGGKMKSKGYAKGGMMKAKGMTKGGAMKAKGAQKGGMKRNMRAPVKKNSGLYGR